MSPGALFHFEDAERNTPAETGIVLNDIKIIDAHPAPYSGASLAVFLFPLVMMLIAFTYGILKIPSLVNSLFTGKSGEASVPTL